MDRKVTGEALPTDPTKHPWDAKALHCLVPLNIRDTTRCECGVAVVVYDKHVGVIGIQRTVVLDADCKEVSDELVSSCERTGMCVGIRGPVEYERHVLPVPNFLLGQGAAILAALLVGQCSVAEIPRESRIFRREAGSGTRAEFRFGEFDLYGNSGRAWEKSIDGGWSWFIERIHRVFKLG